MRLVYKGWPFTFELTTAELQVKLLGRWVVRRIAAIDIESVRTGSALWNEHYTNIWPPRPVTVRRRSGWFKNFVINPPDRDEFVAEARQLYGLPLV